MRHFGQEARIYGNEEWATCENCGYDFIRRKKMKCGRMRSGVRGAGYKTCSRQCARERKKW